MPHPGRVEEDEGLEGDGARFPRRDPPVTQLRRDAHAAVAGDDAGIVAAPRGIVARAHLLIGKQHVRAVLRPWRSEEHTSELHSLMRISYAVFCLQNKILHMLFNLN